MLEQYLKLLNYDEMPEFLIKYLSVPSLVRLKKIGYFCGMDYASKDVYDFEENISRYDHSLTVALLTWKLTKNRIKTLAALFHDISTPCFSHVIDYMNKDYAEQESTEEKTEEIIKNDKKLLEYLKQDHISVDAVINFKSYSVVDNDRPKLCADRLDGIILTGLYWTKSLNIDDVNHILNDITLIKNSDDEDEISFNHRGIANMVLKTSDLIDKKCHSDEDNYMMQLLAKITELAIKKGYIKYDDLFYTTEDKIIEKLYKSKDNDVIYLLKIFQTISKWDIPETKLPEVKARILNPLVKDRRLKRM